MSQSPDADPVVEQASTLIQAAVDALERAQQHLRTTVQEAYAAGPNWTVIGDILGTTRQAAWERFADNRTRPMRAKRP